MDDLAYLKKKLPEYKRDQIVFSIHATIRMIERRLDEEEIVENLLNPKRLEYVIKVSKGKYLCYFGYSKTRCHKYIIVLLKNLLIVSVMKINRRWQRIVEKKARKNETKI